MQTILNSYNNGNVSVTIFSDGTKVRQYEETAAPIFPESIDCKITDWCDAGCKFCHEKSTVKGKHGDLEKLGQVLSVLPGGTEIALGGGNPLAHPDFVKFVKQLKEFGLICNVTVNQKHIAQYQEMILSLLKDDLIYGIGISYSDKKYLEAIKPILNATDNLVFHVIMGINNVDDIGELNKFCLEGGKKCKVLVLGYKQYGRGLNYYLKNKEIEGNKYQWYIKLARHFRDNNIVLSFDNLAIGQMNLRRYFTDEAWGKFYMGDDFVFTMYIDAVTEVYAPSSTSDDRVSFSKCSLGEYFKNNRKETRL